MGLSRIQFYSVFIFISGLDDRTDDSVTKLVNDRGWKRLQHAGRQDWDSD